MIENHAESCDALVVGAGIVGLAIARGLARQGREVLVLERNARIADEISARNSGVIHSGIYYPADSLKATLCVRGRRLLYEYCAEREVAHRRVGKLIVAQAAQTGSLDRLLEQGRQNGVGDLELLDRRQAERLEPAVRCEAALFSPSTGILDPHELAVALHGDVENSGGHVSLRTDVIDVRPNAAGFLVTAVSAGETGSIQCRTLVTACGLSSMDFLHRIAGYPKGAIPRIRYAKGNYCTYRGKNPFGHLVYPLPSEAGLGIHMTLGLDGRVRFGPDVQWVDTPDYGVDESRVPDFYAAVREYWPALPEGSLAPDFAGVRPKLVGPGAPAADFRVDGPETHGIPGLFALLGIESPGITAALAIAERVAAMESPRARPGIR